jgi:PAS domain S-box-containing protein
MLDVALESVRTAVLLGIVGYLWHVGRDSFDQTKKGWSLVIGGFVLLLFGSLLDISDNFEGLNFLIVVGDTEVEAILEKLVGFLGGFVMIAVGLLLWVPSVQRLNLEISERKEAEEALRTSEERLRQAAELAKIGYYVWDAVEDRCQFCSDEHARIYGLTPEEYIARASALNEEFSLTHPEDREAVREEMAALRRGKSIAIEFRTVTPSGEIHHVREIARPVFDEAGKVVREIGTSQEITERKHAENALLESRDQLRLVTDALPVWISYADAERRYRFVNRTCSEWIARPVDEIIGRTVPEILGQEYEKLRPQIERALAGEQQNFVEEINCSDGITRMVQLIYVPHRGIGGDIEGYYALSEDISELRKAEESLHQAQKMEAVGQLTGGIAHDFNNMLAAIIGNLEILGDNLKGNARAKRPLDIAFRAACRAAELTQRLLAFSRQQRLESEAIDLRELLPGMRGLLQTTLTEMIELEVQISEELWLIWADPAQLESAILNLGINARDAMPQGGRLTIEASNADLDEGYVAQHPDVTPGSYVVLAVSDNGHGMSPEVKERVFEPFFTTKEVGKGTGLGLSTIYGLIKQLGGHVTLYSEQGYGTCVKLYLPVAEALETASFETSAPEDDHPRGAETVLVVEDDADVRETAVALLEELGYRILLAENGPAALALLQEHPDVDLLFTDIVMPEGMNGFDLVREASDRIPKLKVLFTSGYSEKALVPDGKSDQRTEWIGKPYLQAALAQKVRQVLDGPQV